jgi:hypothetical protein
MSLQGSRRTWLEAVRRLSTSSRHMWMTLLTVFCTAAPALRCMYSCLGTLLHSMLSISNRWYKYTRCCVAVKPTPTSMVKPCTHQHQCLTIPHHSPHMYVTVYLLGVRLLLVTCMTRACLPVQVGSSYIIQGSPSVSETHIIGQGTCRASPATVCYTSHAVTVH